LPQTQQAPSSWVERILVQAALPLPVWVDEPSVNL
jgi:hypothetical protein